MPISKIFPTIKTIDRFFGKKKPDPCITNNHAFFTDFPRNTLLQDCEFVVIDTELTGLQVKKDEIIAFGAVRIKNLQILCSETFYGLVKPQGRMHSKGTLVHRITPQELVLAADINDVMPRFLDFCGDAYLVGHYVRLDLNFINLALKKMFGGILKTPYLDTMRLAMAYNEKRHGHYYDHYDVKANYNLPALSKEFNLPHFTDHNALQDSYQTAYLFLYLVKKLRYYNFNTLGDYLNAGRNWKIIL